MFSEAFNEAQSYPIASPEHGGDVLLRRIVVCMNESRKGYDMMRTGKDTGT